MGFYFVTFLQDLIDSDLPKAVQLFRSLTEQVRTASFTLMLLLFSKRSHSDHMLVDAQFLGLFSLPNVRHLAVTVAPFSHDNCCLSDFLLWLFLGGFISGLFSAGGLGYESCPGAAHPS